MRIINFFIVLLLITQNDMSIAQFGEGPGAPDLDIKPTDVIIWSPVQADVRSDSVIEVGLRLQTRQNFTIYSEKLSFEGPEGTKIISIEPPETRTQEDPLGSGAVEVYWAGDFLIKFSSLDPYVAESFPIKVRFLGCTERICLFPFEQVLEVPAFRATLGNITEPLQPSEAELTEVATDTEQVKKPAELTLSSFNQEELAKGLSAGTLPMWLVLLAVFLGGLLTNLTPCVFPMIPITIRVLSNQAGSKKGSLLYSAGIVLTYTAVGSIVSLSGGLFGALLANTWLNLGFAVVFVFLGLSMLGFANFSRLQNFGSTLGSGQKKSSFNTLLMGAGAGLVAAPCTGPILGALLIYAAKLNNPQVSVALFFLYSLGFALPYVFLGMVAGKVSNFKVSPKIQVGVKIGFAAVMFALALFYLKTPAYKFLKPIAGYWEIFAWSFAGLFLLTALIVLITAKDWGHKKLHVLPTFLLAISLFSLSQVLTGTDQQSQLNWIYEEERGYELAAEEHKPILIDGWADWCVACKEMDATLFKEPEVVNELTSNWIVVKLDMTTIDDKSEALAEKYQMPGLPTLVLVPADGDITKAKVLPGARSKESLIEELENFKYSETN